MLDKNTDRSRGFGFVTFADGNTIDSVLACEAHAWRLRMPSPPSHEAWCTSLRHFCPAAVTERTHARVARHASREVMRETFV